MSSAAGLRVALFSGNYNYVREGANQALNKLVAHLLDRGAAVRVYSPTTSTPAFPPAGELVSVPSVPFPGRSEFRVGLGLPKSVRRDVEAFRPNIVHLSTPDWLGAAALRHAKTLRVPVVASFHTLFETYLEYYGLSWLAPLAWRWQRQYYRGADRVLAPSLEIFAHLERMGVPRSSIRLWARGVDAQIFTPQRRDEEWRRRQGYGANDVVLLFFGRIVREKGIGVFADTIRELRRRNHPVRPLIVGEGPARGEMTNAIPNGVFTGHLDGIALGRAVASADILLNPSVTEAFGNVNLEAMAAGLAVVSADAASARALISDGHDGLLRPAHPVALADAVARLIDQPETRKRLSAAAVAAASKHQWPDVLDAVVATYLEVRGR